MSVEYRFYCHTCKVRTETIGNWAGLYQNYATSVYDFLKEHRGHNIEFSDFAKNAICCGTCYDPNNCEGDCYQEIYLDSTKKRYP